MMTDAERIVKLKQALIAARYSLAWWAYHPAFSQKRHSLLQKELSQYDSVIDLEQTHIE